MGSSQISQPLKSVYKARGQAGILTAFGVSFRWQILCSNVKTSCPVDRRECMNVIGRNLLVAVEITLMASVHAKVVVDVVVGGSVVIVETTSVSTANSSTPAIGQHQKAPPTPSSLRLHTHAHHRPKAWQPERKAQL